MTGKSGITILTYAHIAAFSLGFMVVHSPVYATPNEPPAVLQFARQYQRQETPSHRQGNEPPEMATASTRTAQRQLSQLRNQIVLKEQQIASQNLTIKQLEEQLSNLELQDIPATTAATPVDNTQDIHDIAEMINRLHRLLSFNPTPDMLSDSLKQANQAVADARDEKERMQIQQAELNLQIDQLKEQLDTLQNAASQTASETETTLNTQLEKLHEENQQLTVDLAASQEKADFASAQVQQLEAAIAQLEEEKTQRTDDQQQLVQQMTEHGDIAEQLSSAQQQQQQLQDELTRRQQQLTLLETEKQQLQQQLSEAPTTEQLTASQLRVQTLQSQLDTVQTQQTALLSEKTKVAENQIKELQEQLKESAKKQKIPTITKDALKKPTTKNAYAIGLSLGDEILQLQAENSNWANTNDDQPSVLAGIIDSFEGNKKMSAEEFQKTLQDINHQVKKGRDKFMSDLEKSTKKFVTKFTQQKETKKSASGFWYQIDYAGDSDIPKNATLDISVKESLADGTVIEDMDTKGIVLTQPISAFPPVFQEALEKLKNHGTITIVVPPKLAYGEKGYPPKVPPNATMIYTLRIVEMYPESTDAEGL